jgi:hypothetical protein
VHDILPYRSRELFYRKIAIDSIEKTIAAANSSGLIDQSVLKGRLREIVVAELLRPFLTPHIKATTGTIVDPHGNQSKQIDIILYDEQVVPPILYTSSEGIIPCHAVVATVEVKSCLDRTELRKAVDNARSVKTLHYDYERTPFSGEVGFRRLFDAELLKILPDSESKRLIEYNLSVISSPACYVFAFTSDLSLDSPPGKENLRLQELVEESKQSGHAINVPISGLCISDREFVYCSAVEPATNTGFFETEVADLNRQKSNSTKTYWACHNVMLKFINHIVNTCGAYAGQRWRIPFDVYFNPSGRSEL